MRRKGRAKNCKEDDEGKSSLEPVNPSVILFEESIVYK